MESFICYLRDHLTNLSQEGAFEVLQLQYQYKKYLLAEPLDAYSREDFHKAWTSTPSLKQSHSSLATAAPSEVSDTGDLAPLEFQVATFLTNPLWAGGQALGQKINELLEKTMIYDELEEARRIFLQRTLHGEHPDLRDVRLRILAQPEWTWALDPNWRAAATRDDLKVYMELKYELFAEMGWLDSTAEDNPVLRFQRHFLNISDFDLLDLLKMDMALPHGTEIFHRVRNVNPFLISYIYNCYRHQRTDRLRQLSLEAL